ncbi:hypothetical protein [Aquimarina algicola]|uniref:Lipoprotein n=1 Tax=Aquimarina algicola TaxID=2589995 RepID=A0A504JI28_9FLAO|nr:hypothetical protein [Aquimarina algicola]TPN87498.1 hypothetical protein FHK87_07910 [Aquimarina algicola]
MKNRVLLVLSFITIFLQSCNFHTPENYFGRTTLNTNKFRQLGKRDFNEMRASKKANMLKIYKDDAFVDTDNYEEYVRYSKIKGIEEDIEKIKELKVTDDTEAMINASLEVFTYVKSIYENEYIEICKLMDTNATDEKIETAIQDLEQKLVEYDAKMEKLMEVAVPYAESNGIKVQYY